MRWRTANKRVARRAWSPRFPAQRFWDEGKALGRALRTYVTSTPMGLEKEWARRWVLDPGRTPWDSMKARLAEPGAFEAEYLLNPWADTGRYRK